MTNIPLLQEGQDLSDVVEFEDTMRGLLEAVELWDHPGGRNREKLHNGSQEREFQLVRTTESDQSAA